MTETMPKILQAAALGFAKNSDFILSVNNLIILNSHDFYFSENDLKIFDEFDDVIACVDANDLSELTIYLIPENMDNGLSRHEIIKDIDINEFWTNFKFYIENNEWQNILKNRNNDD